MEKVGILEVKCKVGKVYKVQERNQVKSSKIACLCDVDNN